MSDIFSGIMKGLAEILPGESKEGAFIQLQADIQKLEKEREAIWIRAGKMALESDMNVFSSLREEYQVLYQKLEKQKEKLNVLQTQAEKEQEEKEEALQKRTCSACGMVNEEGTKFCGACGEKLKTHLYFNCPTCGVKVKGDLPFCSSCGTKLEG